VPEEQAGPWVRVAVVEAAGVAAPSLRVHRRTASTGGQVVRSCAHRRAADRLFPEPQPWNLLDL